MEGVEKVELWNMGDWRKMREVVEEGERKMRINNLYVKEGGEEKEKEIKKKFEKKMEFIEEMREIIEERKEGC